MKNVLKSEQIRAAENEAKSRGVTETFLRMNASLAVADHIAAATTTDKRIAVFCGTGGNGCDGMLAACRLNRMGRAVTVYTVGDVDKFDAQTLYYARNEGVNILPYTDYGFDADVTVDAIFGIGLNRPIAGELSEFFKKLNAVKHVLRIAVDIPSGLNADSGEIMGECVNADVTLSFSCYKLGMLFASGRDVCGRIIIKEIGVVTSSNIRIFEENDFQPFIRSASAHKGTSGRVYIIGGSGTMVGAPMLAAASAHAAYLNGAGTVTVCLPEVHRAAMAARASMAMMSFLPNTPDGFIRFDKKALDGIIKKASAIGIGIGMGADPELGDIVRYLCKTYVGTLVIDADALNAVKTDYAFLKTAKCKLILTPHVGEFERLTGTPATVENAVKLARDTGAVVVLKSATTIITDGNEVRLNISGTPAMAKGGMGDVLCGCITALSCAYDQIDAASVACYRNGVGAEKAVSAYSQMMLTAGDVINYWKISED